MSPAGTARFDSDESRCCSSCASRRITEFRGEICLHFPGGLAHLDNRPVFVFPNVFVCLDCGSAQFAVPEAELELVQQNEEAAA